jgi:catechol 2,3-dioxygenase-like lactoylglutathione lyase family enzyme
MQRMEPFKRIDHIELLTAHPERMVGFYTDVLGFRERSRDRIPSTPHGPLDLVYLELGGTTVEVMNFPQARFQPAAEGLGYRTIALEVTDMDQALAHLRAKGIEAVWGPVRKPTYARAEIRDPDGNAIELRHWIKAQSL